VFKAGCYGFHEQQTARGGAVATGGVVERGVDWENQQKETVERVVTGERELATESDACLLLELGRWECCHTTMPAQS